MVCCNSKLRGLDEGNLLPLGVSRYCGKQVGRRDRGPIGMVGGNMHKFEGRGGGSVSGHTPRAVEGGKGEQELIPVSTREGGLES